MWTLRKHLQEAGVVDVDLNDHLGMLGLYRTEHVANIPLAQNRNIVWFYPAGLTADECLWAADYFKMVAAAFERSEPEKSIAETSNEDQAVTP